MRRVVITGLGLITPLASTVESTWEKLINGQSAIRKITRFDASDLKCQIAGEILDSNFEDGFNPDLYVDSKEQRRMDKFITYGIAAAVQAIEDSGWKPNNDYDAEMTGVLIGSGIGGLPSIEAGSILLNDQGPRKISPFFIPGSLINLVSGNVSIKYGYKGPNHAVVTACSTGAHAIGDAARLIMLGDANVMVAGGTESALSKIGVAGFDSAKALATNFNESPEKGSRPWDRDRDGFVMGEGAGIVVLEEYEHAKKRGAKIYAELIGYGLTGDAYHITAPHPTGDGAFRAMKMALNRANISPEKIDYINAHGTSTPLGDVLELEAVKRLFGADNTKISMSSTKSSIGHLLGAAGSVEAIFSILAMNRSIIPPTINLENPIEEATIDLVPNKAKEKQVNYVLSNSFGFGGTNASLIFSKVI
ncbi:MAG: beta-ketoacyl-ACP synthase II [Alphaproteobacteria bacterium]